MAIVTKRSHFTQWNGGKTWEKPSSVPITQTGWENPARDLCKWCLHLSARFAKALVPRWGRFIFLPSMYPYVPHFHLSAYKNVFLQNGVIWDRSLGNKEVVSLSESLQLHGYIRRTQTKTEQLEADTTEGLAKCIHTYEHLCYLSDGFAAASHSYSAPVLYGD